MADASIVRRNKPVTPMSALIGARFVSLRVLSEAPKRKGHRYVECECVCGCRKEIRVSGLLGGIVLTCGCRTGAIPRGAPQRTHGMADSVEHRLWREVKRRCRNPNSPEFHNYGGRGIDICEEWADSFPAFLAAIGLRPTPRHTLDRIDNSLGYIRGNVQWATPKEQCRNTRRNRILTFGGCSLCVAAWAEKLGMPGSTLSARVQRGWSVEDALTRPAIPRMSR